MSSQTVLPFPCRKPRPLTNSNKLNQVKSPEAKFNQNERTMASSNPLKMRNSCVRSIMALPRSPRKRFGTDEPNESMTSDDLLNAIFKLSPQPSPEKKHQEIFENKTYFKRNKTPTKTESLSRATPNAMMSPVRTILSPIRALSLNSPKGDMKNEEMLDAKRAKIMKLKLSRISLPENTSSCKMDNISAEKISKIRKTKQNLSGTESEHNREDETPSKPIVTKRMTRSSRKAQKLFDDEEQNEIENENKENVDPDASTPSPNKKPRANPDISNVRRSLLLSPKWVLSPKSSLPRPELSSPSEVKIIKNDDLTQLISNSTPKTKRNLQFRRHEGAMYQQTKHALHSSVPDTLVGRDEEIKQISKFIRRRVRNRDSGSLYISGAPGTGKSACLMKVLSEDKVTKQSSGSSKIISINCMSMRNATSIYTKIASELGSRSKTARSAIKFLEKSLTSEGPSVILFLDEMDQLDSKYQEVLYTIFEWPSLENSRLVLVGVANALDLTDRILPRLQLRSDCKPQLLNFRPYTKDQLVNILEERIKKVSESTSDLRVIDSMAVQFCARKVAAVAGDARKALDVCRRAVEMVETSAISQSLLSPSKDNGNVDISCKKVGLPQIASVISGVYDSRLSKASTTSGENNDEDDSFPLQQKLVVCTLILLTRSVKTKEVTLGKLHEAYTKICKSRQVTAVGQSEFTSLLHLIGTRGIISTKSNKQVRLMKVALSLQEKDVEFAMQDKTLLTSVLNQGIPK